MQIVRGGMKAPIATGWVTVADISGTGTAVVTSGLLSINTGTLPALVDIVVEVEYTQTCAVADVGFSTVIFYHGGTPIYSMTASNITPAQTTTMLLSKSAGSVARRVMYRYPVMLCGLGNIGSSANQFRAVVTSYGSVATTEHGCTGIQMRLIYTPL